MGHMARVPNFILEKQPEIAAICREFGVRRLELFGSAAREHSVPGYPAFDESRSDLDFVVKFDGSVRLPWAGEVTGLASGLERIFNQSVDLLEVGAKANPYLLEAVNRERMPVYVAA